MYNDTNENTGGNAFIIGVVTGILGLAVGFLGASILLRPAESIVTQAPITDTKAANFRVSVNNQYKQHVNLLLQASRAEINGKESELAAIRIQLEGSADSLSDAFASSYGEESANTFLGIWDTQVDRVLKYSSASRESDSGAMETAENDLVAFVESLSTFLADSNSNLPKDAVAQLLAENITLIKASINAFVTDNFAESYSKQSEAVNQASSIADALSGATVKQFSENYE